MGGASSQSVNGVSARIGMLVPSGNIVAEEQVRAMVPAEVALHVTRLPLTGSSDAALSAMIGNLPQAAQLLADARVDLIAFNCTAVSTRSPGADADIARQITQATHTPALSTGEALVEGLRALKARRIVLVTPYVAPIVEREAAYFAHNGFEVLAAVGNGIDSNWDMAQAPPQTWYDLALANRDDTAEAYVLSCTAIRSAEVIEALESALGRPVLTSNQALAWFATRRAGVSTAVPSYGVLLHTP
jgi:maleate isomerase